ncbi:hypothetical protein GCM10009727_05560 [Actinomadura napierensis]|uniref:Uncharacterized protein n=2 Tax=Actinomadura napierensis TaxID=267854 RepID=A0ABN2Y2F4_9ACTN
MTGARAGLLHRPEAGQVALKAAATVLREVDIPVVPQRGPLLDASDSGRMRGDETVLFGGRA